MNWRQAFLNGFKVAVLIVIAWISPAFSCNHPPTPTQHFYGDADGDTAITPMDLNILRNLFNGKAYKFDTLQPDNPDQDWNTCDLDGDRHCTPADINILINYLTGKTLSINDKPWVLESVNLPLAGNHANHWIPFTVNLYSTYSGAPSGRPGVSVIAEIDPSSTVGGKLKGRRCDPDPGGGRDQAAPDGAQCALAVTKTDWGIAPGSGITEEGDYGFAMWANGSGNLVIKIRIEANEIVDIPAVSITKPVSFAKVWYVRADARGANNGKSWADAFTVVQDGVNAASSGDQVWVAQGTYTAPAGIATTESVAILNDGVQLYGGFAGIETNLSQRGDPTAYPTILDGQNTSYHVVVGASGARLDGFTVANGAASAAFGYNDADGGGIYSEGVTGLVIANSHIINNIANTNGGGIAIKSSSDVTISNCVLSNNQAALLGGGLYPISSVVSITDSAFSNNSAGWGGGIRLTNSSATISDCTFEGNSGSNWAGGIDILTSTAAINRCYFKANSSAGGGGGISSGNDASGNLPYSLTNSILINNVAPLGGAIYSWMTSPQITNCTITQNTGTQRGGALFNDGPSYSVIKNSVIWLNSSPLYPELHNQWGTVTVSYSDVQGGYSGTGNKDIDPLFFGFPDVHLQSGSPCINTGTATGAPSDDFDGYPRPYGGAYDMGAYEWHP